MTTTASISTSAIALRICDFALAEAVRGGSAAAAVERGLALIVPDSVTYARLDESLAGLGLEEIQSFRPVDLFRGGAVPAGHYSLLLRLTLQSMERTLAGGVIAAPDTARGIAPPTPALAPPPPIRYPPAPASRAAPASPYRT